MTEREKALARYNWLTVREVAQAIRRSEGFVQLRCHKPAANGFQFDCIKDGAGYLINPADLPRYFETHKVKAPKADAA